MPAAAGLIVLNSVISGRLSGSSVVKPPWSEGETLRTWGTGVPKWLNPGGEPPIRHGRGFATSRSRQWPGAFPVPATAPVPFVTRTPWYLKARLPRTLAPG